jgi:HlyD family secretion protein
MKTRRHGFYFGGALLVIALAIIAVWPRAVEVEAASVDRGAVRATIVDEGRTRMREVYVVSAPVPGRLLRVAVEPGDIVVQGEPLARMTRSVAGFLDPRSDAEARAVVNAAEARETAARAERELAEIEASRAETLATQRLIATAALDTARTRLRAARAAESAASAELRRARSALLAAGRDGESSTLTLNAPSAGVVLRVPQESEATVAAGTPVVVLGDPSRLDVIAEFLSQDAVRVQRGDRAFIENWGEQGLGLPPIPATVERIEPVARTKVSALGIEEQRTNIILGFDEAPPPALRAHDFRVDVRIVAEEVQDGLRVPLGALFRQGEGWAVFVVREGRAWLQPVELGPQDERFRIVRAGLAEGDRVVLFPTSGVRDGVRLTLP